MFIDSTTKVDNETLNGSNEDITTPYECEQTLIHHFRPAPQRKEKCTLQCALSSKEEKSSWTRASINDSCNIQFSIISNPIPQQPCNLPKRDDWDSLFQPMFDEYFNPPTIVVSPVPVATAPRAVDLADSPVSTSFDQDAPSTSIPSTQDQEHSLIIS
ncbi:hypothetical protein Tco_0640712 [Tanacetum coccineum]